MKKMRLDKYLGHIGYGSRSEIQKMIKRKQVKVDGVVVNTPNTSIVANQQVITVNDIETIYKEFYYFILNKPQGVITATEDSRHKTVIDLLEQRDQNKGVAPVGRLDIDTEGLLLLTNDGQLNHQLMSPKKHVEKTYYAKVEGKMTEEAVAAFASGICLEDGTQLMPGKLEIITSGLVSEVLVTIKEGKFHQVKRMIASCGGKVIDLKRISIGKLQLPEDLAIGSYREMTDEELALVK